MLQTRVRTGELDRRVTFIKKELRDSVTNEDYVNQWIPVTNYPTVWARKRDLPGNELIVADRITYIQKSVFTIRYRNDLRVDMRLVFGGQVYEILSITEPDMTRNTFLDILVNILDNELFSDE